MESRDKEINSSYNHESQNNEVISDEAATTEEAAASFPATKQPLYKRIIASEFFTKGIWLLIAVFFAALVIYTVSRFIPSFAEFWTRYPAQFIRFILAKATGWLPFSLAECIIVSIPIIGIGYIVGSCVSTKRDESNKNFYRWVRPLASIVLIILTIFLSAFGPAYGRNKLSFNLGLEQNPVSADELYETGVVIAEKTSEIIDEVNFDLNGASVMPYDYHTLVEKVNDAFDKYAENVDYVSHFSSTPKPIALSEPMTYTYISGVYTFMTGESNVNTNYPDFLMPFTMAHEMAHQRGIAREDEANFVAFLVCIGSDDNYIRYSGYSNMANYLLSALSKADKDKYADLFLNHIPENIAKEFVAYSLFFDKYRDSTASTVTDTVNNAFLQSQGQQAGTKSYGLVVDLAVAYYKK